MRYVVRAVIAALGLGALSGCAEMLPGFDRIDNPDIHPATLQAGRVVNGVKCAVSAFLVERNQQLIQDALKDYTDNTVPVKF